MAATVLADTGFLFALLTKRDREHPWAVEQSLKHPRPWFTCEAVLTEAFHLLGSNGPLLSALVGRAAISVSFSFNRQAEPVLKLLEKYASVPMSFADACLVRMSEVVADPIILTTDSDFRVYRRHGRQTIPHEMPGN